MNILMINHYAGSQSMGMEFRPYYLAKEWKKKGHNVTIVAASYSHLRDKNILFKSNIKTSTHDGVDYLWIKTKRYSSNSFDRLINTIQFSTKLYRYAKKISKKFNPDVVIVSSPHPFIIYGGKQISKVSKAKLIFEVRDLWPLSLLELYQISTKNPFIQLMQRTENYSYRNANHIVTLLPYAEQYMREHGAKVPITYLPNAVNIDSWERSSQRIPNDISKELTEYKRQGMFIFGYAGTFGKANALETMISAAKSLKDQKILFVLVGEGDQLNKLSNIVKENNLKNVIFFPRISKNQIPDLLSYFDSVYLGWLDIKLYQHGISPNKLMDYLMAKKPVIHAINAKQDIVEDYKCGISVNAEDSIELSEAILRMSKLTNDERNLMGENGQKSLLRNHSYEKIACDYLEIMK